MGRFLYSAKILFNEGRVLMCVLVCFKFKIALIKTLHNVKEARIMICCGKYQILACLSKRVGFLGKRAFRRLKGHFAG